MSRSKLVSTKQQQIAELAKNAPDMAMASNTDPRDEFGISLCLSADLLVIAAPLEDSGATGIDANGDNNNETESGAIYLFE